VLRLEHEPTANGAIQGKQAESTTQPHLTSTEAGSKSICTTIEWPKTMILLCRRHVRRHREVEGPEPETLQRYLRVRRMSPMLRSRHARLQDLLWDRPPQCERSAAETTSQGADSKDAEWDYPARGGTAAAEPVRRSHVNFDEIMGD
jgi:hypothetical protein